MNPDAIDPVPFLITLALLVAAWLIIGIRDRRRRRRAEREAGRRALAFYLPNLCADVWQEGETWCVCTRPLDHAGPCTDDLQRVIRR